MKKFDIIEKIPKMPIPDIRHGDVQIVLKLITVLASTHLANKVNKIIKNIDKLEHPDEFINILK